MSVTLGKEQGVSGECIYRQQRVCRCVSEGQRLQQEVEQRVQEVGAVS